MPEAPRCIGLDIETRRWNAKEGVHLRNTPFVCGAIGWADGRSEFFKDPKALAARASEVADIIFTHNAAFDAARLEAYGAPLPREKVMCTQIMAWLLDEWEGIDLDDCARRYLGEEKGAFMKEGLEADADDPRCRVYNEKDAILACRLGLALYPKLVETGVDALYRDIDMPMLWLLNDATNEGMLLDSRRFDRLLKDYEYRFNTTRLKYAFWEGAKMNIGSPKQVWRLLYRENHPAFEMIPRQKDGTPKTGVKDVLKAPFQVRRPEHKEILEWRKLKDFLQKYLRPLSKAAEPDGRVHSIFNLTRARTGRLSSGNKRAYPMGINIQSTPKRNNAIREAFVAPAGHAIVCADADQVELRILAHIAKEPALIAAFHEGQDIHSVTAAKVFGVPFSQVTESLRSRGKTMNFAVLYGSTEFGVAHNLGVPVEEGREFIRAYYVNLKNVKRLKDAVRHKLERDQFVKSLRGRRQHFPDFNEQNWKHQESTLRKAFSHLIQGSAADLLKEALANAYRDGKIDPSYKFFLTVHDEFVWYVPSIRQRDAAIEIKAALESSFAKLLVPITFKTGYGPSWGAAKGGPDDTIEIDEGEEEN